MKKFLGTVVMTSALGAALLQGCAAPQATSRTPAERFSDAEKYFQKQDYDRAIEEWKKVKESYESPEMTAKAELGIADAYFLNKSYIEAAAAYEDFRKLHPKHEKAAYALFRQGVSYYMQIQGIDTDQTPVKNTLATLDSYAKLYPDGEHMAEVRDKVNDCMDKRLQYEVYVGRFYLRENKYPAAIARFEEAVRTSPGLPHRDEALYYLGRASLEGGQREKGREALDRLLNEFPNSTFAAGAKTMLAR